MGSWGFSLINLILKLWKFDLYLKVWHSIIFGFSGLINVSAWIVMNCTSVVSPITVSHIRCPHYTKIPFVHMFICSLNTLIKYYRNDCNDNNIIVMSHWWRHHPLIYVIRCVIWSTSANTTQVTYTATHPFAPINSLPEAMESYHSIPRLNIRIIILFESLDFSSFT